MLREELEEIIKKANQAYWIDHQPIMSDIEYDKHMRELEQIDPHHPLLSHIGGTKGKYRHDPPMLSLGKAYGLDEVIAWAKKVSRSPEEILVVQPKYDGLAAKIENNHIYTRGDGTLGDDITHVQCALCCQVYTGSEQMFRRYTYDKYLSTVNTLFNGVVYGEILISYPSFRHYCTQGRVTTSDGSIYKNTRNAVAGIVNQKDLQGLPNDILSFVPYQEYGVEVKMKDLQDQFLSIVEKIVAEIQPIFPIDGIVVTLQDHAYRASLGATAHHPRGSIAYKFTNVSGVGKVHQVIWQQGKEVLTPVILLQEPVVLSDCYITRVTGHNYKFLQELHLHVGQKIKIEKAGDIIPKLVEVYPCEESTPEIEMPTVCPCCGAELTTVGVDLVCCNPSCIGKIVPRMVYAAKITNTIVQSFQDVTELWHMLRYNYEYDISLLPGFTDHTAGQLYRQIRLAVGSVTEAEVLAALCIPGIGLELAKKLLSVYPYQDLFLTKSITEQQIAEVIGPTRAKWIIDAREQRQSSLENMYRYFNPVPITIIHDDRKKLVCFSGAFHISRKKCQELVESHAMRFTDHMSSDVSCLVVPTLDQVSTKTEYAKKHKIPIMTMEQFTETL